ncbi:MAG TPA: homocysteine S-methyltransferase family protein, partial [Steroidobacteraceae bacterium]|nr:homocysteine S-methyltransferase family protein [Steroidobacteraceae bacterium]
MKIPPELPTSGRNRYVLLDGGTGRELLKMGAPFRQPEWSALALMEAPEFVSRVHRKYVAAGADVITTNSYAIVPFHIGQARFASEGAALAELAGKLARAAADSAGRRVWVAGSLPPVC